MDYPLKHYPMLEHLVHAMDSALFLLDSYSYEYGAIRGLDGVEHSVKRMELTHDIVSQRIVVQDVFALIRKYDSHFTHQRVDEFGNIKMRDLGGNDPRQDSVSKS